MGKGASFLQVWMTSPFFHGQDGGRKAFPFPLGFLHSNEFSKLILPLGMFRILAQAVGAKESTFEVKRHLIREGIENLCRRPF